MCYLGPLGQSLVVNCLNQKGVIEVVNLVDFKRYHEKVDLSKNSKMNIDGMFVCFKVQFTSMTLVIGLPECFEI